MRMKRTVGASGSRHHLFLREATTERAFFSPGTLWCLRFSVANFMVLCSAPLSYVGPCMEQVTRKYPSHVWSPVVMVWGAGGEPYMNVRVEEKVDALSSSTTNNRTIESAFFFVWTCWANDGQLCSPKQVQGPVAWDRHTCFRLLHIGLYRSLFWTGKFKDMILLSKKYI